MKVLIAEDEQTIANGIAAILKTREEFHCQIRFAENGLDALEEAVKENLTGNEVE